MPSPSQRHVRFDGTTLTGRPKGRARAVGIHGLHRWCSMGPLMDFLLNILLFEGIAGVGRGLWRLVRGRAGPPPNEYLAFLVGLLFLAFLMLVLALLWVRGS